MQLQKSKLHKLFCIPIKGPTRAIKIKY